MDVISATARWRGCVLSFVSLNFRPNYSLVSSVYVLFVVPAHICVPFCLFSTACISVTIKY